MTFSFPKSNGNTLSGDEATGIYYFLKNIAINQMRRISGIGSENFIVYDDLSDQTNTDTTATTMLYLGNEFYTIPCTLYDDHNDSSIDTNKWDIVTYISPSAGSSWSYGETSSAMYAIHSKGSYVSGSDYCEFKSKTQVNTGEAFMVKVESLTHNGINYNYWRLHILLTDGTNYVTLKSIDTKSSAPSFDGKRVFVDISSDGTKAYVYDEQYYSWTQVDISSLTPPLYPVYRLGGREDKDYSVYIDESYIGQNTTTDYVFQTLSICSDNVKAVLPEISTSEFSGNTSTLYLSVDGTNFEEVTNQSVHIFSNTGSNLKLKYVVRRGTSERSPIFSGYSIMYTSW